MGSIAVTGSASGMGAATVRRLRAAGHDVIGVDVGQADVVADLGTGAGRADAVQAITSWCGGELGGVVTCAGLGPLPGRSGGSVVSVNYFGTVVLLERLRPLLEASGSAAAVAIASNAATTTRGLPQEAVASCLAGDEDEARRVAEPLGGMAAYPATKLAVGRWVRRNAPTSAWIGSGIRLNAIAPGLIETAMLDEGRADPVMGPFLERFRVPAGRPGTADEIAATVEFLLGPGAAFVCGTIVYVDGGTDALVRGEDWPAAL
ncbi:MAG: SDR family oxidoreductase [Acidimicrobiia bacterium]